MPGFKRAYQPGGTFFITLVTYRRRKIFKDELARTMLRNAIDGTRLRRPFKIDAIVLLPDHLHFILTLPDGDADFTIRIRKTKEAFTRAYRESGARIPHATVGQHRKGLAAVWQPRFWEHTIRNDDDFRKHVDYIHYNPVKHGYARCPHTWPHSSFHQWVNKRFYELTWGCECDGRKSVISNVGDIGASVGE